jgi:hypothetical protein
MPLQKQEKGQQEKNAGRRETAGQLLRVFLHQPKWNQYFESHKG